ncbi:MULTISPECIES: helix-turn-helix domain-containing protein [Bacteroides]|uniref:AraC family transcriptional regulator n=1 Tax=Bacteroides TaxID=816 RepID=UPI00319DA632
MEQQIAKVSFTQLHRTIPFLKSMGDVLLMTNDAEDPDEKPDDQLFKYPFRLDGIVIILQEKGDIKININLKEYVVKENSLLICSPGDILQSPETLTLIHPRILLISPSLLQEMQLNMNSFAATASSLKENPIISLSDEELQELIFFYGAIRKSLDSKEFFHKEIIFNLIGVYIYKIGSIHTARKASEQTKAANKPKREQIIFNQFIRLVSEHHCKERQVSFYAEKLYLSPKYLSAIVRNNSERTAKEWIDDYVILEIKSLLKYSTLSIQEITNYLNFPNQSFLGKFFKQHTGMAPSKYK